MEKTNNPTKVENNLKKGFFEYDDFSKLPKGKASNEIKDELRKYSYSDLVAKSDDGSLKVRFEEFRGFNARITRSISKNSSQAFYKCEILITNTTKYALQSKLFTEDVYQEILLSSDSLSYNDAEITIPARVRFGVGTSDKNGEEFKCVDVILPGIKKVLRDFPNASFYSRVNLLSVKTPEECKKQGIMPWNNNLVLYRITDDIASAWDLDLPTED